MGWSSLLSSFNTNFFMLNVRLLVFIGEICPRLSVHLHNFRGANVKMIFR